MKYLAEAFSEDEIADLLAECHYLHAENDVEKIVSDWSNIYIKHVKKQMIIENVGGFCYNV